LLKTLGGIGLKYKSVTQSLTRKFWLWFMERGLRGGGP
jgi:hypothetical protein